jgi:hypothetical protein
VEIIKEGKSSEKVSYKDMEFKVEGEVAVKEDSGRGEKVEMQYCGI